MEQSEMNVIPEISVVVPVYNGEKYLRECIDSILNQTFKNIELLLIDDGSKDSSGKICDEYAYNDRRVRVIHKDNEGINATRKRGVFEAKGEWVVFVDNDDSMPLDALDSLYLLRDNTDIVIGFPDTPKHRKVLNLEECRRNAITAKLFPPVPWAKLYRRSLFSEEIFDFPREIDGEEDMIMNIRLLFHITRAPHLCFKKVYNFRRNTASVSHTKIASLAHEQAFDEARCNSIPVEDRKKYMNEVLWSRLNGLVSVAVATPKAITEGEHEYLKQLKKDISKYKYHTTFQDRILLYSKNIYLLRCFGGILIVKNFIKYHLHL